MSCAGLVSVGYQLYVHNDLLWPHSGATADQTVTCECLDQSTLYVRSVFLFKRMDLLICLCLALHRSYIDPTDPMLFLLLIMWPWMMVYEIPNMLAYC